MKPYQLIALLLVTLLGACEHVNKPAQEQLLQNSVWEFQKVGDTAWLAATVPGCVHTDLLAHGLIPDPFYGTNEDSVQWVENANWQYRTRFSISESQALAPSITLNFEALDTYAAILLDGEEIGSSSNAFRPMSIELTGKVTAGAHELVVVFESPVQHNKVLAADAALTPTAQNDAGEIKVSPWTRKPAYQFGWDWAPRLLSSGIVRPVELAISHKPTLRDVTLRANLLPGDTVGEIIIIGLLSHRTENVTMRATITGPGGNYGKQEALQMLEHNSLGSRIVVANPELWWPAGMGEQAQYTCAITLHQNGEVLDSSVHSIGFRTVELVQQRDSIGTPFYFKVNGEKLWAKGANIIPQDAFPSRVEDAWQHALVRDMVRSNFNMVRVWGGGSYLPDAFYDACDSAGILVWQDFMFANAMYPDGDDFHQNVAQEVASQSSRLAKHPSIAVWCGNNEIDVAWHNWGWQDAFNIHKGDSARLWDNYQQLFKTTIPEALAHVVPDANYISTSPLSNWGTPENFNHHNMHYWGVWHGEEPFAEFANNVPRFMSEYGFQSFPEMRTIKAFSDSADWDIDSDLMSARQKSYKGTRLITEHMERHFNVPNHFEDYAYTSQLLQAKGMRMAINAHRSGRPHCMGTLYWQLNDCWPGISWSGIDYFGRWKAAQYAVKDRYQEVIVVAERKADDLLVSVVSDRMADFTAQLIVQEYALETGEKVQHEHEITVKANAATEIPASAFAGDVVAVLLIENGELLDRELVLAATESALSLTDPQLETAVSTSEDGRIYVSLKATNYAHGVFLSFPAAEGWFTDNYFNLLPGELKTVEFVPNVQDGKRYAVSQLQIRTLNQQVKQPTQ